MRKILFSAAIAVCLAVPGMSVANTVMPSPIEIFNGEIDAALASEILKRAAEQCSYDYCGLQQMYDDKVIWIEKTENGYLVTDGGGLIIEDIWDDV